ncbi:hypothetical protein ACIBO2_10240 [Nonomuraea sp. NPDC050022]|uniref:hypothetical protein n=1 Tax=unclassified Nonomuraea TaxID=2593643 RepID=UPI0033D558D0
MGATKATFLINRHPPLDDGGRAGRVRHQQDDIQIERTSSDAIRLSNPSKNGTTIDPGDSAMVNGVIRDAYITGSGARASRPERPDNGDPVARTR